MTYRTTARERFVDLRKRLFFDHDLTAIDDHLDPEFNSASPMVRGEGGKAYRAFVDALLRSVPDLRPTDQQVLVEDDH